MIPTSGYISLRENRRKCLVSNHGWESMPVTFIKKILEVLVKELKWFQELYNGDWNLSWQKINSDRQFDMFVGMRVHWICRFSLYQDR